MMMNGINIKPGLDEYPQFIIHPAKAAEVGLNKRKFACLSFGMQKHYVKISLNGAMPQEDLVLSPKLIADLHLPDYPIYEISVNESEIIIGPYIGLLLSKEDNKLTSSCLNKMLVYVREYSKLRGSVVVFALDKVNPTSRLIEGYCYHPANHSWQRGVFPYPSSIYRTIGLSSEWKNHFLSAIGDKIFNNRYFNKWEMYQWFSNDPAINPHIPYTELYHSPQNVLNMLERFQKIYIKPVSGLRGHGIVRINTENSTFIVKHRKRGTNCCVTLEDQKKAVTYIKKRFSSGRYLIQQAINLLEYKGGIIDFRCVMQKNQSNAWACNAIIGRWGVKDSIVSNISSGGVAFPAEVMLEKLISPHREDISDVKKKIEAFAVDVCDTLDEYGVNCGTLGLDIGIDTQGRLWLIEINNRDPDPSIALNIHDRKLYYTLKSAPLFYAKFLAGFKPGSGMYT